MLKFYPEIDFREMRRISRKNVVDVTFLLFFSTIFRYQPIRCTDLIEFKNYFSHLLIDFANCLPTCYADDYLKTYDCMVFTNFQHKILSFSKSHTYNSANFSLDILIKYIFIEKKEIIFTAMFEQ